MSGTGSLTLNLPIKAPAKKLSKCLPDPPTYSGKRSELHFFINQLHNKLEGNKDHYTDTNSQLHYAVGCLRGDATETVYPFQPDIVEDIVIILKVFYGNPNQIATA